MGFRLKGLFAIRYNATLIHHYTIGFNKTCASCNGLTLTCGFVDVVDTREPFTLG